MVAPASVGGTQPALHNASAISCSPRIVGYPLPRAVSMLCLLQQAGPMIRSSISATLSGASTNDRYGVTTHAIGVGNAFTPELECISNAAPNSFNLFNFSTFDEFEQTFQDVLYRLISGGASPSGDPYVCVGTRGLGTNGCS